MEMTDYEYTMNNPVITDITPYIVNHAVTLQVVHNFCCYTSRIIRQLWDKLNGRHSNRIMIEQYISVANQTFGEGMFKLLNSSPDLTDEMIEIIKFIITATIQSSEVIGDVREQQMCYFWDHYNSRVQDIWVRYIEESIIPSCNLSNRVMYYIFKGRVSAEYQNLIVKSTHC